MHVTYSGTACGLLLVRSRFEDSGLLLSVSSRSLLLVLSRFEDSGLLLSVSGAPARRNKACSPRNKLLFFSETGLFLGDSPIIAEIFGNVLPRNATLEITWP